LALLWPLTRTFAIALGGRTRPLKRVPVAVAGIGAVRWFEAWRASVMTKRVSVVSSPWALSALRMLEICFMRRPGRAFTTSSGARTETPPDQRCASWLKSSCSPSICWRGRPMASEYRRFLYHQAARADIPPARDASENETVGIQRLDLSLSMGPGTNIDDYIEVETVEFDIGFLRGYYAVLAGPCFALVSGIGDSMFPTLLDTDLMFLDVGQRVLNMQDRIWGISLYGAGAIKRLRAIGGNKVAIRISAWKPNHE
jgi:hypothetical protein